MSVHRGDRYASLPPQFQIIMHARTVKYSKYIRTVKYFDIKYTNNTKLLYAFQIIRIENNPVILPNHLN